MNSAVAEVLFVGDYPVPSASLARLLSSLRCEWRYVTSSEKALTAMEERHFRVVLSKSKLADGSGRRLIPAVQSASGWLFLSFPVEDGCWWIPVVEAGRRSVEAMALHSRDFHSALEKIVKSMVVDAPRESSNENERLRKSNSLHGERQRLEQSEKNDGRSYTPEGNPASRK